MLYDATVATHVRTARLFLVKAAITKKLLVVVPIASYH